MDYSTGFFLDDDELFTLFATDQNPPLMKSRLFRLNVSNGMVELQGMKGNILALRKLKQTTNNVLIKLNSGATIEVEGRLQELGFGRCAVSTREGFSEFQKIAEAPAGYTKQCDLIKSIWRSWWPIAEKTLNGRAAVLVFQAGAWYEVQKIETGDNPTIYTKTQGVKISSKTEVVWAIDTRFAKSSAIAARGKQAYVSHVDERAWTQETILSGSKSNLAQTLQEIHTASYKWIGNINSIDSDVSGLLDESREIDQRKRQIIQALEYLLTLS